MNREEIDSGLRGIVSDLLGLEPESIYDNSNFIIDLHADSLDAVEIIMGVEDHFNIDIADEEAEKSITFSLLANLVESKLKE